MTLAELGQRRNELLGIAARFGARNVRVFGSVARGEARSDSDVDLLVEFEAGRSLMDHAGLKQELEALLNCSVDVASERGLKPKYRDRILGEAVAV